jgi:NADH:ubiquinone oxidoreductase subunit F (NADH-binding)
VTIVRAYGCDATVLSRRPYRYEDLDLSPADLLGRIAAADLRGRGGAAFPLATKLRAVMSQPGVPVVVANGEEGEPGSIKDRHLMRTRPDLVLDGLLRAASIVSADRAYVYVSDRDSADAMRDAVDDRPAAVPVHVVEVEVAYVAGEETAVVRYIDGGPALPVAKPPRPFERGIGGAPTLVSNVETLAQVALLAAGVDATGHMLITVSGTGLEPTLFEVPATTRLIDLLNATGSGDASGALMGGMFGGLISDMAGPRLDRASLAAAGTSLGNGVIHALRAGECPVDLAADALAYLAAESSRQCGVCVSGTRSLAAAVAALRDRIATTTDAANIARWSAALPSRGACGLLDAAARVAGSLVARHPQLVAAHTECAACAASSHRGGSRFTVSPTTDLSRTVRTAA